MPDYTFVPWLRRGVAAEITQVDTLGADPDAGPDGHATLAVALTLNTTAAPGAPATAPRVERSVAILGPGDVGGVKAEAIIRTQPRDGALDARPGVFAYVDFFDEDFPWRYTPAGATATHRLRPWLALLVLTDVEFTVRTRSGRLPVLTLAPRAVTPPATETWAWAHAQLSRAVPDPDDVGREISADPLGALSRLLCPRHLESLTAYHAFLVPAFETGRLAGLGRDASTTPAQRPAWGEPQHADDRDFPVYHRWSFTTGEAGDFETLARRLRPRPAGPEFGTRALDVSAPGYGMPERSGATVALEGALAPPAFLETRTPFDAAADVAADVQKIVDAGYGRLVAGGVGDDPLVLPPIYGAWHAGVPRIADAGTGQAWLTELNLDLRARAVAGLGAAVVRERQEELVQRAWEQVGAVEAANQRLREAELSRAAADGLLRKHLATVTDPDRLLILTAAAQPGLVAAGSRSVRGAVDVSRVPAAAQAPAFRRITRPQRPLMRRLTGTRELTGFQGGMLTAMNAAADALSAAPPEPAAAAGVALGALQAAAGQSVASLAAKQNRPDRVFLEVCQAELKAQLDADPTLDLDLVDAVTDLRPALVARVDSRFGTPPPATDVSLVDRVKTLARNVIDLTADGPGRAVVTVAQDPFEDEFSDKVAGKTYAGVTVRGDAPAAAIVSPVADPTASQAFANGLNALTLPAAPDPADQLTAPITLASQVLAALAPARTLGERLAAALPVVAGRPATDPARLAPIMAHPHFRDPTWAWLAELGRDHIIPNVADLEPDSMCVLEPNHRHLEAFLAGANHAFAQELLWREYPTDQRGSYFRVFWDTSDAIGHPSRDDIAPLHEWKGALGAQTALPTTVLVLVVRGALLQQYPSTVISVQRAAFGATAGAPRRLATGGEVRYPILHARLDPDITLVGFQDLTAEQAKGTATDPGWFFVLMERPGEPQFGLDDETPDTGRRTWNDLAWDAIAFPAETPNLELAANAALTTTLVQPAAWGRTAADMAAILHQSPVLLARHAAEMLP